MPLHIKARTLFLIVFFAAGTVPAQQTSERRENSGILASRARGKIDDRHGTTAGVMSADDRLLVISAALGRQGSRSKPDCSHLVHEIYSQAGFPYFYSNSSDLYSGINEFHRVKTPQVADLIVWPGHMGIVVSPAQHSFYSSLRSGVGIDYYDSSYWRGRGEPRFYRYVKRTKTADVPSSPANTGSEEQTESSTVLEPAHTAIMDALAVESVRLDPGKIRDAFLKLSEDYGNSLRGQDLLNLRAPVVVFDQVKVEKMKVKGKKGSVEIRIDGPLSLSDGRIEQKKRRDRQRWTIEQRDRTTWQVRLPSAAIYLSRDDAVRLFAQQLAILTDGTHDESSCMQEKAELARALNVLLAE
jgi:hypothetical protein